jgi:hypothetical protein
MIAFPLHNIYDIIPTLKSADHRYYPSVVYVVRRISKLEGGKIEK